MSHLSAGSCQDDRPLSLSQRFSAITRAYVHTYVVVPRFRAELAYQSLICYHLKVTELM